MKLPTNYSLTNHIYIFSNRANWLTCSVTLRKDVKQMSGQEYWWVPKTLVSAWEITLYCESYKGKKAVVDVRAEIKHPTWSLEDQLV